MPNPSLNRTYTLQRDAAQKANQQITSITDYLTRFLARLEELNVAKSDPLYAAAATAKSAMIELGIAVVMASKAPGKTKWE